MTESDEPNEQANPWNLEGDDLAFLRNEGLELLAMFKRIRERKKRQVIFELVRLMSEAERPRR